MITLLTRFKYRKCFNLKVTRIPRIMTTTREEATRREDRKIRRHSLLKY